MPSFSIWSPYMLSVSPLDCEALDYMLGFDFNYRGNHDALVIEALGASSSMESLVEIPGAQILDLRAVDHDQPRRQLPSAGPADDRNPHQCVSGPRGEFPEDQISVYFTVRNTGSLESTTTYEKTLHQLQNLKLWNATSSTRFCGSRYSRRFRRGDASR